MENGVALYAQEKVFVELEGDVLGGIFLAWTQSHLRSLM